MDADAPPAEGTPILVIMGVAGSGKTTVGRTVAARLGWPFLDADAFHPPENVEKMRRGEPLDDADRRPWLEAMRAAIAEHAARSEPAVFTCSALKRAYRSALASGHEGRLLWVHLQGDPELIAARLRARRDHFMPPGMLASQFEALEAPPDALTLDVTEPPERLADAIVAGLPVKEPG